MTHKTAHRSLNQFLRKLKKLEKAEDLDGLDNLSQERIESLEDNLDLNWIDDDPTEWFDLG
jgi:plasmid maintenance system killer protein